MMLVLLPGRYRSR